MSGIRQAAYDAKEPDPYINPSPRCTHGKVPYDGIAYCYSYAKAVDDFVEADFVTYSCPTCGLWKDGGRCNATT